MATQYYKFSPDFATFMTNECAWPDVKRFALHLRSQNLGYRNDAYHRIRHGGVGLRHYFVGFVDLVLNTDEESGLKRSRESIVTFLQKRNIQLQHPLTTEFILGVVCEAANGVSGFRVGAKDWLSTGLTGLQELFNTKRAAERHIQRCRDDKMIREAARWLFMEAGQIGGSHRLAEAAAIAAHEADFKLPLEEYTQFASACLKRHPWTVVLARGERKPTGLSIMLPLSAKTYNAIRDGSVASFRTDPADFVIPSRHIVYEVVIERPLDMGGEAIDGATRSLLWCVLTQFAVLSRVSVRRDSKPIRLLSFAGAPASKQRLERHGFSPVGRNLHRTNVPLYERTIVPMSVGYDFLFTAITNLLGKAIDGPPPK